jgi:NADH-quinone oxidoreductase subunit H
MQDRIGANRAAIFGVRAFGLFHPIADALKMITKEDFVPEHAHRLLFNLAPFISLFFALVAFAALPFGNVLTVAGREIRLQIVDLNVGFLYVFAMMSLEVYGVILAGWSSNNNYSFLGGMRALSQMLSYEITIGAAVVGIAILYQSLNLNAIVQAQGEYLWGVPKWGVILQPLGFLLFLTAGVAETKRIPFDLPEGESEIIGYFLEYSGMKFGMFMMTDFVETVLLSGMVTTLFFGGWQVPYLFKDGFHLPGGLLVALSSAVVSVLQILSFCMKVFFFCWFLLLIRWTLPRFRYDQVMRLGWKVMLPLSLINILVTGFVVLI